MTLITYEGVVQKGSILLNEGVQLPENAKVYVVVTNEFKVTINREKPAQLPSFHLARRKDAKKLKMKVTNTKQK